MVDSAGRLGTITSSARFKEAIQPMDKASEAILALHPGLFITGTTSIPMASRNLASWPSKSKGKPRSVARDEAGTPYTVRYEAVNAMLLNEFLKEHRRVQTLEASLAKVETDSREHAAKQQNEIDSLTATLKAQAGQIRKVSDQLTTRAQTPRVVAKD